MEGAMTHSWLRAALTDSLTEGLNVEKDGGPKLLCITTYLHTQ